MSKLAFEPASSLAYHTGDWRTQRPRYHDKWPPCGQACPASEDVQAWLALASEQQWEAAWRKLTERNPLPATMGRVCFHPCESACNRHHLDEAVNIHAVERHLGDLALAGGWRHARLSETVQSQRIAVVGAGPAGLSCAFQLARRGYPVTLFEAAERPGGTLASAVPAYRLPPAILQQEIEAILELGVELRLNTRIGRDVSAMELRQQYDAVLLAVGAQQPRLYQDADDRHKLLSGIEFLRRINRGERPELASRVAVVGGGNTAIDVARCARRLGAEVTVVCAHDRHGSHHGVEMSAARQEVEQAEAEGVQILYRSGLRRVVRSGGHLSGLEIARVDQVHDREGRFAPLLFEGTEHFLPAAQVIFAIGQTVDWQGLETLLEDAGPAVQIAGDAAGKPRFAPTAVGSGYQAAMALLAYLSGVPPVYPQHHKAEVGIKHLHTQYYPSLPRHETPALALQQRLAGFAEIHQGLDADHALAEATRCLSCGVCFHCDNCWHFCPDAAVIKTAQGYRIDYDYCKGCGICAQECPCGHIDMDPEPA